MTITVDEINDPDRFDPKHWVRSVRLSNVARDTAYLLPPSLLDWLPEKHLARFVVDIVGQLDLSELITCYGGGGKQPYHPAM
ncbi:MAG: hypothetical protein DRR04_00270 [Gammaproteobacteria bacterium]|nr:MAG: hypothetical protein DRQ97_00700 [Gammaproteobacteria bacterium]RLA62439.1 MAG: hypothetical protein DRR04_00270 [Gammaproteobacteria bacterium]